MTILLDTTLIHNIYPAGHTVTPQMERDAVEWFVAHLNGGSMESRL